MNNELLHISAIISEWTKGCSIGPSGDCQECNIGALRAIQRHLKLREEDLKDICVIKVLGFANGVYCPVVGKYLKSFDHEAYKGRGYGEFTDDVKQAQQFKDKAEALLFWARTSRTAPVRPDGKPNRPLTATSVEVVPYGEC